MAAAFFPGGGYAWGAVPLCAGLGAFLSGFWLLDRTRSPRQVFLLERPSDLRDRRAFG
jgi:hypothetical protein